MNVVGTMIRRAEVEFFLRLHGLWEAIVALPPPPEPPFDVEKRRGIGGVLDNRAERDGRTEGSPEGQGAAEVKGKAGARRGARQAGRANQTMEPIEAPPHAIWRDDFEEFGPHRLAEADPAWEAPELDLGDGRRLVLDAADPFPEEEWAVSGAN